MTDDEPDCEPEWLREARRLTPEAVEAAVPAACTVGEARPATARDILWALTQMARTAYHEGDLGFVGRAFAYASWCNAQKDPDLWNPAGVGFFAKVARGRPDQPGLPIAVLADHLSRDEMRELETLFEHHYGEPTTAEIKRRVLERAARTN